MQKLFGKYDGKKTLEELLTRIADAHNNKTFG